MTLSVIPAIISHKQDLVHVVVWPIEIHFIALRTFY